MSSIVSASMTDPYKWAESVWDGWFYEVLAEVRAAIAEFKRGRRPINIWTPHSKKKRRGPSISKKKSEKSAAVSKLPSLERLELAAIASLPSLDSDTHYEVEDLTCDIEEFRGMEDRKRELAELLVRRGALYRQVVIFKLYLVM